MDIMNNAANLSKMLSLWPRQLPTYLSYTYTCCNILQGRLRRGGVEAIASKLS